MVTKNLLDSVIALPREDRLELIDHLRDSLRQDLADSSLSDEQRRILDECLDEFERDPDEGSPWEEVEARLRANVGHA